MFTVELLILRNPEQFDSAILTFDLNYNFLLVPTKDFPIKVALLTWRWLKLSTFVFLALGRVKKIALEQLLPASLD